MIIFPAKSREGFSQLPGRPLTLLPNRLTVAIRSKRRRIQPGPDQAEKNPARCRQNYRANFDFDSALDICQESGVRRLNRLVFSLWRLIKLSATQVKVGFNHQGENTVQLLQPGHLEKDYPTPTFVFKTEDSQSFFGKDH